MCRLKGITMGFDESLSVILGESAFARPDDEYAAIMARIHKDFGGRGIDIGAKARIMFRGILDEFNRAKEQLYALLASKADKPFSRAEQSWSAGRQHFKDQNLAKVFDFLYEINLSWGGLITKLNLGKQIKEEVSREEIQALISIFSTMKSCFEKLDEMLLGLVHQNQLDRKPHEAERVIVMLDGVIDELTIGLNKPEPIKPSIEPTRPSAPSAIKSTRPDVTPKPVGVLPAKPTKPPRRRFE